MNEKILCDFIKQEAGSCTESQNCILKVYDMIDVTSKFWHSFKYYKYPCTDFPKNGSLATSALNKGKNLLFCLIILSKNISNQVAKSHRHVENKE
jgi:hypothetical protein